LINEAALQMALHTWLNRPVVFADLQAATRVIADVYRSQGRLARPQLPAQDLIDGVVTVQVIEARVGEVRVADSNQPLRFDRGRLKSHIDLVKQRLRSVAPVQAGAAAG
jgi:hemolysin activation/secretion protein